MAEYISRNDALLHSEIIRVYSKDYGNIDVVPVEYLANIPSTDVQPVKRGRWVCEFYNDVFDVYQADCSVCKKESTDKYDKVSESYEYCPHCGARMDLKENDVE